MTISSFFKLVEIQTKVASVIPFIFGTSYVLYKFDTFNLSSAILLFLSMLIFDMTTTAINNYIDYRHAIKKEGYGYESHNAIVRDNLNPKVVRLVIYTMLLISSLLGLILFLSTNIIVLLLGIFCFIIGIIYSFGPIPISRTPFGEIFSGLTMGLLLTFISIYIHIFDQDIILLAIDSTHLSVSLNYGVLISLFIITLPLVSGIANIMLANNICDMEDDLHNKRYTLPLFIGKEASIKLFITLYFIGFGAILLGVILGILPWVSLITLLTLKPVIDHLNQFKAVQSKEHTFILAVKNFLIVNVTYVFTIILCILCELLANII
ncbi:MAG: 1,4-dihydroxy-2-naphthoate polyprenyltransferase [Cellulosilyticaceae bacterium]